MAHQQLKLPDDPAAAVALVRETSRVTPVLVFKKSPICPVSFAAESEFDGFIASLPEDASLHHAKLDVLARKPLARGITRELGIDHASPQALWFLDGELAWHGSHHDLTDERFRALISS